MDALAFLVFLIVIWILQGIGKLVEFIAQQQQMAQQEEQERQQGGATTSTQTQAHPEPQTPFEALMRYMEDQARGHERAQRPEPPPPPQPPPPVYVAPEPAPVRGQLAQRHLRSNVSDRHRGPGVGDRHIGGLAGRAQLTGFRGAEQADQGSLEAIESLHPWQKAIVYTELLGPPRSQEPWRVKKL